MLQRLRETAVRTVKPRVTESTWKTLRTVSHLPGRAKRSVIRRRGHADARQQANADQLESEALRPLDQWDLPSLARHFGTDKWGAHRFALHYEHHFQKLKAEKFTLLEIGIGGYARENEGGASLRMWKAFFPRAQIVGLDIEDKSFVVEPRITAHQGSQTSEPLLRTVVSTAKNLRIVIDDGSHRPEHIRRTFTILFPLLPAGALYAIEDTQTSYWPRWGGSLDLDDMSTTMGMVKRMIDGLNYEEWQDEKHKPTAVDRSIVAIHCYHNLVIVEKGPNNEGTARKTIDRAWGSHRDEF